MLTFSIRGVVADIDGAVATEPFHPAVVIVLECGDSMTRVIVPTAIEQGAGRLLERGRSIEVMGEVRGFPAQPVHVAIELRPLDAGAETLH